VWLSYSDSANLSDQNDERWSEKPDGWTVERNQRESKKYCDQETEKKTDHDSTRQKKREWNSANEK